jgi:hypothetical protein
MLQKNIRVHSLATNSVSLEGDFDGFSSPLLLLLFSFFRTLESFQQEFEPLLLTFEGSGRVDHLLLEESLPLLTKNFHRDRSFRFEASFDFAIDREGVSGELRRARRGQYGALHRILKRETYLEISISTEKVNRSFVDTSRFPDICRRGGSQLIVRRSL